MRWFGGLAACGVIAAACSTFTSEGGDAPATNDGGPNDANDSSDAGLAEGGPKLGDATTDAGKKLVVLATENGITDLVADDTYVYWGSDSIGSIRRMRLDQQDGPSNFEDYRGAPARIRIDGNTLLWGDETDAEQGLWRDGIGGGGRVRAVTTRVNNFAKTTGGIVALIDSSNNTIHRVELGSGAFLPDLGTYNSPIDILADGDDLYWTGSGEATVWHMPAGATAEHFADNESDCQRIAKNSLGVYWTRPSDKLVRWRKNGGTGGDDFATDQEGAYGLAADDSGVFWLTSTGLLMRRATSSSPVENLVSGLDVPSDPNRRTRHNYIALTNKYVVWATASAVMTLER